MIKIFPYGLLDTNTYVVWEEKSKECMVIDCGVKPQMILPFIEENGLTVKYVVLTHGHFDHAEYALEYESVFDEARIVCHENELLVLEDADANLSSWGKGPRAYKCDFTLVKEGDILTLGDPKNADTCLFFQVLHTPGHTPGGICLYNEKFKIMFTGDTLFKRSYGRTDFKYGDENALFSSLKRLYRMDRDIVFYPGHYGSSTIKEEISF